MGIGGPGPASGGEGGAARVSDAGDARKTVTTAAGATTDGAWLAAFATAGASSVVRHEAVIAGTPPSASQQQRPDVTVPDMAQATGCAAATAP